jgi:hypothetical protein
VYTWAEFPLSAVFPGGWGRRSKVCIPTRERGNEGDPPLVRRGSEGGKYK